VSGSDVIGIMVAQYTGNRRRQTWVPCLARPQ
jgi:hypothetical protein